MIAQIIQISLEFLRHFYNNLIKYIYCQIEKMIKHIHVT